MDVPIAQHIGQLDVWPDAEALMVSWLKAHLPDVNVRTETDATFGTAKPNPSMRLPLVLISSVTTGASDSRTRTTQHENFDVACYGATRAEAWGLYHRVHAWVLRSNCQTTPAGSIDDVWLHDTLGVVPDSNPNLRRVIATYGIATRAQATA